LAKAAWGKFFAPATSIWDATVALKVLPPGTLTDDHARRLFRKEADSLSKLNHPNIVTVHDFDTQENLDYLVMEHVPGTTLSQKLCQGPLAEAEVIRIGIQLAEGLAAAHEQGIIHGDLKPGNLRLTSDNRLKILDFGLARSVRCLNPMAPTESLSGAEPFAGTLSYMAPEQLRGQAIDARTDVYSAGVVLYELATGQLPFSQKLSTILVDSILHQTPVPPTQVRPGISPRLEEIILRCLEKEPQKRCQSAKNLLLDLQQLASPLTAGSGVATLHGRVRYGFYGLAACVVVAALLAALGLMNGGWRNRWLSRSVPRIESLAVLPLANLSGDPEQDYLADGMTEALITDLGQIHAFQRIISRTSVVRYKTERTPLREIARQLDVDAVIEGSVLRSEKTVQVTVRLVNATDDTQLWSRSYQSEFRDLLTLRREMALAIAKEIKINLTAGERARLSEAHAVHPEAQEAYLRAESLSAGTSEQRAKARQYFEQAIQFDPAYAAAYAGLADYYWNNVDLPAREAMPKAREYALKALELDETMAHAHTALAAVHFYGDWDWVGAAREFQRALDLNPNDAETHRMYSVYLTAMGRFDEALGQVLTAQKLDPLSVYNNTTAGWTLYCARRYDQATEQCQHALELAPNYDSSHACLSYSFLGKGAYPQAVEESKKAWTLSGDDTVRLALLGRTYAQAGNRAEAGKIVSQLLSRQTYVPPYFFATLYVALGDKEMAFRWLEKARPQHDLYLAWIKVDPAVDPLRSDPRFQELLRNMGLSP
jgi:serine/threonine-protein kinase